MVIVLCCAHSYPSGVTKTIVLSELYQEVCKQVTNCDKFIQHCMVCIACHVHVGCAVLLCLVCLTLLASFFLPSHLSFKNMYILGLVFGVIGDFVSFILS